MKNKTEFMKVRMSIFAMLLIFTAMNFAATSTLTIESQGDGYVDSYPSGILCGAACFESYNTGTVMTLTAHPTDGASFS